MDNPTRAIFVIVAVVLVLIVIIPAVAVLASGLSAQGLPAIASLVTTATGRQSLWNTLQLGVLTALIGTALGFCLAYAEVRMRFFGRRAVHALALLPIVSPPFAVASAVIALFGRNGLITHGLFGLNVSIYGLPGLLIVMSLAFSPIAYLTIRGMLQSLDPSLDEAGANLGASQPRILRTVTLPLIAAGLAGALLFLFMEAISDLADPLVIGGDYTVITTNLYRAIVGQADPGVGAGYSIALLLPALFVFLAQHYWVSRRSIVTVTGKPTGTPRPVTSLAIRIPVLIVVFGVLVLTVLVYGTIVVGGFVQILGVNNTFTLQNYLGLTVGQAQRSLLITSVLAVLAAPISGVLAMVLAWLIVRRLGRRVGPVVDFIGMLGVAIPGIVIGLGYALAYSKPLDLFGVRLLPPLAGNNAPFAGALAVLMVFVLVSLPVGQRAAIATVSQIHVAIEEAAISLGDSSVGTFRRITLPLLRPAFIAGLSYAVARAMTVVTPIIFIVTPGTPVIASQILAEVDSGRFGNAFAYCTTLIVLILVFLGIINLVLRRMVPTERRLP
jgi:iron(III) transport system permease protein